MLSRSIIFNHIFQNGLSPFCVSILNEKFFSVVEIWDTENLSIWKQLGELIPSMIIDVSLSPLMMEKSMSIIDTDESVRLYSLNHIFKRIDFLSGIGIYDISISSPENVVENLRFQAIELLAAGLTKICAYANSKGVQVSFEPFDRDFHKFRLVGTTDEFIKLANDVGRQCSNFSLTWDSAHVYLQDKKLLESLKKAVNHIKRIHFANASIYKNNPYYGDCHIPFGEIGDIEIQDLKLLYQIIMTKPNIKSVAFEIAVNEHIPQVNSPETAVSYIKELFCLLETSHEDFSP